MQCWKDQQNPLWTAATGHGKDRFKISELFADEVHQSSPRFKFASNNGRGQNGAPRGKREEAGNEVSEWETREREEQLARMVEEAERFRGGKALTHA